MLFSVNCDSNCVMDSENKMTYRWVDITDDFFKSVTCKFINDYLFSLYLFKYIFHL